MRVLVLGAGFGGLELTSRLSDELGDDVDVTLIDRADGFVMGFSKLDVMFGHATADHVRHSYENLVKPGVRSSAPTSVPSTRSGAVSRPMPGGSTQT